MSTGIGEIKDEFLTKILGVESYRIEQPELFKSLSINKKDNCFEYVRLDSNKANLINDFCRVGFKVVCQEFEFVKNVRHYISSLSTLPPLNRREIKNDVWSKDFTYFAECFKFDRFSLDRYLNKYSFRIKREWISNIFCGLRKSDILYGYEYKERPVGFLSAYFFDVEEEIVCIDLICVAKDFRNRKCASMLIDHLSGNFNVSTIVVNTQANNYPAIALYKKMGFQINQVYTVLHRFNKGESNE